MGWAELQMEEKLQSGRIVWLTDSLSRAGIVLFNTIIPTC